MAETRARDLASSLGQAVKKNNILINGDLAITGLSTYTNKSLLPGSYDSTNAGTLGFTTDSDKLYIHTGQGWFNVGIINTTPVWETQPANTYDLATDATAYKNGTATTITLAARDSEGMAITWSYVADSAFNNMAYIASDSSVFTIEPKSFDSAGSAIMPQGSVTFKASDGINIATASSTFTLKFDATIVGTKDDIFHLKAIGAAGGHNLTIVDSEPGARTWETYSNPKPAQGRHSPYAACGYSCWFDGSSDGYINVDGGSSFQFGTGDFTIECWFKSFGQVDGGLFHLNRAYLNGERAGLCICFDDDVTSIRDGISGFGNLSDATVNDHSSYIIGGNTAGPVRVEPNEWHHIAMVRASGVRKIYLDGIQIATKSDTTNYDSISGTAMSKLTIGAYQNAEAAHKFKGWIADFRIVKGTAVYTAAFDLPYNKLEVISGTSLLACQNPAMVDISTNKHTIDAKANMRTAPYSPYKLAETYDATLHGGSWQFKNNQLTTPGHSDFAPGTGAYTYDFWFKLTEAIPSGTKWGLFQTATQDTGNTSCNGVGIWVMRTKIGIEEKNHAGHYPASAGAIGYDWPSGQPWINTWYHCAVSRDSSSGTLRFFLNGKAAGTQTSGLLNLVGTGNSGNNDTTFGGGIGAGMGYQYISDLRFIVGTGLYTSDFDLPTKPTAVVANTQVKMNATNAKIVDTGGRVNIELENDTQVETGVQKNSIPSVEFDGTGDKAHVISDDFYWPTLGNDNGGDGHGGSGTWELWIYGPGFASGDEGVFMFSDTKGGEQGYDGPAIYQHSGTWKYNITNSSSGQSQTGFSNNTWTHIALCKQYNEITIFRDGVLVAQETESTADHYNHKHFTIGQAKTTGNNTLQMNGEISDFKISRKSKYPFLPVKEQLEPTTSWQLGKTVTASNVKFLGCNSATVTNDSAAGIDRSSSNQITSSGTITASTFAPINGMRSLKFGGGYLRIPVSTSLNNSSTKFTFEMWIYPTQQDTNQFLFGMNNFPGSNTCCLHINSSNQLQFRTNGTSASGIEYYSSGDPHIYKNRWYHVGVTKESGSSNDVNIWLNGHYGSYGTWNQNGGSNDWIIGNDNSGSVNWPFNGYISNARFTIGQAVYSKNFTPPGAFLS